MTSPDSKDATRGSTPGLIETMTIDELRAFDPEVIVIPLGSTEPHGPHLPYGTDTIIVGGVTARAVELANAEDARVLRLPPLPIGNNVNFKAFPFACRLSVETLMATLNDLVQFAMEEGVRKVVIASGHGGNDPTVRAFLRQAMDHFGQEVFVCACSQSHFHGGLYQTFFKDGSPHAGDYETSMVMALAPGLVVEAARKPAAMNQPAIPALGPGGAEWVRPWHLLMPEAYAGNPEAATAEKGKEFVDRCTLGLARFLVDLSAEPWHPNFPYKVG